MVIRGELSRRARLGAGRYPDWLRDRAARIESSSALHFRSLRAVLFGGGSRFCLGLLRLFGRGFIICGAIVGADNDDGSDCCYPNEGRIDL